MNQITPTARHLLYFFGAVLIILALVSGITGVVTLFFSDKKGLGVILLVAFALFYRVVKLYWGEIYGYKDNIEN